MTDSVVIPFVGLETYTTNYGWTKPEVGASIDVWGDMLNADLDGIDSTVHGIVANSLAMEALTITSLNQVPPLTYTPSGSFLFLVVNGMMFLPVGASPPFSVSGTTITWLSTIYSLNPGDSVAVAYSR